MTMRKARAKALVLSLPLALAAFAPLVARAQQPAPPPAQPPAPPPAPPPKPSASATTPPPDLPPPPPPPWTGNPGATPTPEPAPTAPAGGETPPTSATPAPPSAPNGATVALEHRVATLEHRLAAANREIYDQGRVRLHHEDVERLHWLRHFKVTGFVQPQLVWQWFNAAASPNNDASGALPAGIGPNSVVAKSDGTTTNPDFFRMRRARLKVEYAPTDSAKLVLEIDPTPTGGPSSGIGTIARNVEAVGIVHWPGGFGTTEFGMGIFKVPFGYEVLQSDADRPFIERSWMEQNLFPGEYDTGARAYSSLLERHLGVQLAIVNGITQGEKTFAVLPDLNKGKDIVGRFSYDLGIATVGVSGYYGQGQIVDATLFRFKQFPRWAYGFELGVRHKFVPTLGETRFFGELQRGQNMDRGTKYSYALPTFPSDIPNGDVENLDELGWFVRLEQDLGRRFTLAARYDWYTPNSAQGTNARGTIGVVGVVHFTRALQWMVEYDHAVDNVHKAGGAAPSKQIDTLSNVLQARF